jgi:glycosyltransferase involved in cell wall biosynthesis
MRAEWGFSDRIVVLSTRRLHPLYRVGSIIRAVAIARKTEPRLALVIVGDGPEYEGLRHVADEVGLAGSVAFMGGIWSDEWPSMPDVQMGADLCCSVPETDGGPLSVLEAMAAALPIVTTDVPVMREWVADTGAGRLWTGDDEAELAHLILGVLPSASAMGQSGRDYVVRRHRRADEMDRVFALYESLARTRA